MSANPIRVVGVSGSMNSHSHSASALRIALDSAQSNGAAVKLLDLNVADLPMFRPGVKSKHPALLEANANVSWAEAFILATPDYHGSMSGALKNFLDYHWKALAGKLFGYICSSHEKGLLPMEQMRTAVRQCYGWSMPYGVAVHGEEKANTPAEIERLKMLGRDLVVYGTLIRDQFQRDLKAENVDTFSARYRA
ncbi:MAG: NAD(P)H-dependent oxidoreductase [Phycisphaerae bacterium]|nr:NAD(P)H-dependent oxidoreductase [Phycisphaerae bacterium]